MARDPARGSARALAEYRRRRDFGRTREPRGGETRAGGEPVFVVQIHDASTLHYDFRLEVDGTLKSWAVPKGPSADPHDKRLAMPTEDHPMEYRDFEGVIAEGEYGAGTVIVWDEGGYRNISRDRRGNEIPFAEALARGHASFRLDGSKLRGDYALTRFRGGGTDGGSGSGSGSGDGSREAWLLVKREGGGRGGAKGRAGGRAGAKGAKGNGARTGSGGAPGDPFRARSALSGRTLGQVSAEAESGTGSGTESEEGPGSGSGTPA
ncbi:DNA polymerase ligase N-terminal domain-containing protein [Streptomyces sp. HPF1205]|uniref:DNA polymerase ligase N-terminal domain-containing protein n=1 Tax=Streptomyces sp. HPF1205 TaxID=2873262 RepID=UPI001CECF1B0|nr:DNA polymerase ligase N-terminal domain-containing protein [Streptomyces sp. HPF1205]